MNTALAESNKLFVLDTNILMNDPVSIFNFQENNIFIPMVVLEELDKGKKGRSDVARNARQVSRFFDELINKTKDVSGGILLSGVENKPNSDKKSGKLFFQTDQLTADLPASMPGQLADNSILSVAIALSKKYSDTRVILVSKDINMRIKATALGIIVEDYYKEKTLDDIDLLYSGSLELYNNFWDDCEMDSWTDNGSVYYRIKGDVVNGWYPNQFLYVADGSDFEAIVVSCDGNEAVYKLLSNYKNRSNVFGVKAKNKEQNFLLNVLQDPEIDFITVLGRAGTGKTILTVATGLKQIMEDKLYNNIIMTRETVSVGEDIGFLPGPQPLSAKIRVPDGYTTMGELKKGSVVSAKDGSPSNVLGIFKKGVKSVYKVTTTEGETECCLDHLWFTTTAEEKKRGKQGKVRTTKDILNSIKSTLNGKKINSNKPRYGNIKPNHFLPRNKAIVNNKPKDFILPPYVLGALLGDGSISNSIVLYNPDKEISDRISRELDNSKLNTILTHNKDTIAYNFIGGCKNNKPAKRVRTYNTKTLKENIYHSVGVASNETGINKSTINTRCLKRLVIYGVEYSFLPCEVTWTNEIKDILFNLGLSNKKSYDKFIPNEYLNKSSIEDRISLLQGLMDTDGCVKKETGEASFCTTSERLAKDISYLVRSLGGRSVIRSRDRIGNSGIINGRQVTSKRVYYEFTVSLPVGINPFYFSKKANKYRATNIHDEGILSIEYIRDEEVQCILIDNPEHLYITDDHIVTHNTEEEKMAPWMGALFDNLEVLGGNTGEEEWQQDASKSILMNRIQIKSLNFMRGRTFLKKFIILDEAQNLTPKQMKTLVTRAGPGTKVICMGNLSQIDTNFLTATTSGLTYAVDKFKSWDHSAHITLKSCERSRLADFATDIL